MIKTKTDDIEIAVIDMLGEHPIPDFVMVCMLMDSETGESIAEILVREGRHQDLEDDELHAFVMAAHEELLRLNDAEAASDWIKEREKMDTEWVSHQMGEPIPEGYQGCGGFVDATDIP